MFDAKAATKIGLVDGVKSYAQTIKRVQQLVQQRQQSNSNSMNAFAKIMAIASISEIAVWMVVSW
jgi:hypothetical protein